MHYVSLWQDLKKVDALEKLAESDDVDVSKEAQVLLADTCDKMFATLKKGSLIPELMAHRESHRFTGEKVAEAKDTAVLIQKLATAEYVDNLLEGQLEKLSGAAHDDARMVQLLGREYAVQLIRGLFA